MATRMLPRTDPKLPLKSLRNPSLAHPQFTVPVLQTKTVNEALLLPLNQNLQLFDFLGVSQKLVTEEASSINVRKCFNGCAVTSFAARGRESSRHRIDSEDDEDVDEDGQFEDFDKEMEGELDDDFEDDFEDIEDEDDDFDDDSKKFSRKK